jgi:hypothetical protein
MYTKSAVYNAGAETGPGRQENLPRFKSWQPTTKKRPAVARKCGQKGAGSLVA